MADESETAMSRARALVVAWLNQCDAIVLPSEGVVLEEHIAAVLVDWERTRFQQCDGRCDIVLARRQFPDGSVPGNARECAEGWERAYSDMWGRNRELEASNQRLRQDVDRLEGVIEDQRAELGLERDAALSFQTTARELEAEVLPLRAKALQFDLDQAGIEGRARESVELVEARADIARLRSLLEWWARLAIRSAQQVLDIGLPIEAPANGQLDDALRALRDALSRAGATTRAERAPNIDSPGALASGLSLGVIR